MKKILATAAIAPLFAFAAPASATVLLPGQSGVAFSAFDASTRGTQLGVIESGTTGATTYTGFLRSAVYQNTLGTLDFYYQVAISSINAGDEVFNLTTAGFQGYTVDALVDGTNFDGAGIFTAASNPNLDPNEPAGSTTTASRNGSGSVLRADFGLNGLEAAGQTSATYIFRTNATNFNLGGTFTTQDGSVAQRANFQPAAAVPEPATWAMMVFGFGVVGFGMRRRKSKVTTNVAYA
ncbi:PEPxxWA-CTERM sorting domain-containing protein [Sphingomonas rubra]|uniref:PEP-CTERM protein-sorting domain-containing protein n=1 Tax=Sphingomonas rubra TaxID=634430 RepID=A0A1I5UT62_9SPHN|nr:PEPxxWA-CTERM sorting domain-containing protein [Sphingomonas rubra]SFP98455.1 PEP-CTERM protein-sorting domain-containing protein [Sphingomonas rubra]